MTVKKGELRNGVILDCPNCPRNKHDPHNFWRAPLLSSSWVSLLLHGLELRLGKSLFYFPFFVYTIVGLASDEQDELLSEIGAYVLPDHPNNLVRWAVVWMESQTNDCDRAPLIWELLHSSACILGPRSKWHGNAWCNEWMVMRMNEWLWWTRGMIFLFSPWSLCWCRRFSSRHCSFSYSFLALHIERFKWND